MADTTGKDTQPSDPKAQEKTGPVRPPVLEGTARTGAGPKPAEPSAAKKPEPSRPSVTKKPEETSRTNGTPWLAGIVGGAIGLGAAYGLAWFGLWPVQPQSPPPADPRIAQFATAIPDLQTRSGSLQNEVTGLATRLSAVEANIAALPAETTDSGLAEQVAALAAELDALSTTPAPDSEATAGNADAITALQEQFAALQQESQGNATRLAEAEAQLADLASAAEQASENPDTRLPFIFSGLESAFAAGRPYEGELAALRQVWPEAPVPQILSANAATGLPRPEDVARRFNAAIPDMLAGRPANADASWQDSAMDWVRGVVAMRPLGDVEGDSPDAIVARLETAMARRDFSAARQELAALPDSMRNAAASITADIALLADAETFLASLRQAALNPENGA